jgi:hypothetical protein
MFAPHFLVGSGGTFTTVAELVMASKGESNLPVPGYRVSHAEIRHLIDRLRKLPIRARRALPGMTPDRADIIIAGLTIIDGLLKRFRVNTLVVHTRGVRDGLVREMLEEVLGANSAPVDHAALRDAAIERLASACSGEVEHGRAVASLAGRIWEQLAEPLGLDPADRPLLECAARLQDVGYVINYDKHHKHSYHLIRNSRLPGIRAHDLELIANVARYPFGHGLTYGDLTYGAVALSSPDLAWDGSVEVSVAVTNAGDRAVEETVQLYIHDRVASLTQPVRRLRNIRKLRIDAGATATARFSLDRRQLMFMGGDRRLIVEPGQFHIWAAPSAQAGEPALLTLTRA